VIVAWPARRRPRPAEVTAVAIPAQPAAGQ
jgi:hypothetical protein